VTDLDVRIVEMEPMRVACAHGFGASPELQAIEKMLSFLDSKGLRFEDVRWFGFNNPDPSPGSPNYGYDVWATVGPEIEAEGEITMREIPARRYAVARCEGLEHIGEVWRQLVLWFEDSPYRKPPHWYECLENLLVHPDTPFEDYVFDLHLPIKG
jgi:DNA gyrase inhibitor GyrI